MSASVISLTDLLAIQRAFLTLSSIVNEVNLSATQFDRKLDCVYGRVVLDRVMNSLKTEFEVVA
jgi:hypothetical protein